MVAGATLAGATTTMVDGGPAGGEAVQWTIYFKEGGVGTFVPYFFRWVERREGWGVGGGWAAGGRAAGPVSP